MAYLAKILVDAPRDENTYLVTVAHDDWCPILRGATSAAECICEPVILWKRADA